MSLLEKEPKVMDVQNTDPWLHCWLLMLLESGQGSKSY